MRLSPPFALSLRKDRRVAAGTHCSAVRLREAYFIAIVTPAIKHLRKELHEFDTHSCALSQPLPKLEEA